MPDAATAIAAWAGSAGGAAAAGGAGELGVAGTIAADGTMVAAGSGYGAAALSAGLGLAGNALLRPKAPGLTAPPPLQMPNGDAAAAAVANRAKGAAGFSSTNVTGPTGLLDPATTAPKTLLGG